MEYKRDPEVSALPRERRLNMRLMAFWWDKRADRRFPRAEDFNPEELNDVWTHCFKLRPDEPNERSSFQYVGETLAETSSVTSSDITVGELDENTLLEHATRNVSEVLRQQVPVVRSGEFLDRNGDTVLYRSILLPVSEDGDTIDCVVGGARCKVKRAV